MERKRRHRVNYGCMEEDFPEGDTGLSQWKREWT